MLLTKTNKTALQLSAIEGNVDIAKVLIRNDADVNAVDKNKMTALHYAAEKGHVDSDNMLIQNGADVNACDTLYQTAHLLFTEYSWHMGTISVMKVLGEGNVELRRETCR